MPRPIAARVRSLEPFLAMEVMEQATRMEARGVHIDHLEVGEPDFPPPPEVIEACARALAGGETRYTDSRGLAELREEIAADHERRAGVSVSPDRVLVTSGTSPAMLLVFSLLLEAGDEVVIGTPHYPCYPNFVRFCGGTPVFVETRAHDGYQLDPEAVRRVLSPRTRALVVNSPANPTGAVQSEATLRALAALDVPIVSDEIYDGLVYGGARATCARVASPDAFVLDGFSKRYAMTGFRLGYVIAPDWARRPLQIAHQNLFISANRFVQRAGIAALRHGAATLATMLHAYGRRRRILFDGLRGLGFDIPVLPDGAFYLLADARGLGAAGADSRRLAFDLLERAHVGVAPGVDFGDAAEGKLRFSYAASEETLERALESLAHVLPELRDEARERSA